MATTYKYGNVYGPGDFTPGLNPRLTPTGVGGFHKTGSGMETYMLEDPIPDPFGTDLFDRVQANEEDMKGNDFLKKFLKTQGMTA